MTKQLVFMGRPPDFDDKEALLEWVAMVCRRITGKEPTPEEIAASRRTLGLPPTKEEDEELISDRQSNT
jgi:hypothetical protein